MPYDTTEVARQIEQSRLAARAEARTRESAVERAVRIYRDTDETVWEQRVQHATLRRWVAMPLTPLSEARTVPPSGHDYCVVATDSSFVAPDKHRGSLSYLINVGRVMIRYGNVAAAELDNTPTHYPATLTDTEDSSSGRVLQAQCALLELEQLLEWSRQYRPDLALLDGSLMQLVLVLSKDEQIAALMNRYFETIRGFEEIGVPVAGYISQPDSQMVMRAVRMLACEQKQPCEKRPAFPCSCRDLWSITDSDLFWGLLDPGERSAVFVPQFSYLESQGPQGFREMVFAYLGTEFELTRLEFPEWVLRNGKLDRVISVARHQCALGKGYPVALTRAHQFAVLQHGDRETYFYLLEKAGLLRKTTEKAHGKRMIGQAI